MLLVFALTLFCSATLLFMVEPMIGKMILPLLGGTPAVWNTCMVFFQAILLLGYGYAHLSTTWLGSRKQAALHLVLLAVPFLLLPVTVNRGLIKGDENPVFLVLLILSLSVGLPMFVVSASAPLLQKWFASTSHPAAKDPYFLYGASNLGSMLALIAYPTVVEPYLRLAQQSFDWTIGYGVLVALTALCAVFLWLSPSNAETVENIEKKEEAPTRNKSLEAIQPSRQGIRTGGRQRPRAERAELAEVSLDRTLTGEVTWMRVLRWVTLAFVPSSLMLGATTYITTDIAAIPLLWVAPLALYLLSFILVFSHIPAWFQSLIVTGLCAAVAVPLCVFLWDQGSSPVTRLILRALVVTIAGGSIYGAWQIWTIRDKTLLHRFMVLVMPLLVLGLLFFMLSELKIKSHWIAWSLAIHLTTLFVVSMVCHGELARDRPAPKYLTGYFLWMSVGGVLGGLFNGLVAPLIFTGIAEYELAMMLACFLAPPLGPVKESVWGRRADLILAGLFVAVTVVLIPLRLRDHDLSFEALKDGPWPWELAALLLGAAVAVAAALREREKKFDRWMDLVLPLCLGLLLIGLSWGLFSDTVWARLTKISDWLGFHPAKLRRGITYGVPIIMCYTFIERSLRFALGVGAILLASSFCGLLDDHVLHQERSFFGVLKVEHEVERSGSEAFVFRRLIHGTTLHGMQFLDDDRRDEPVTYYHITGPIGQVMQVYNKDNKRNLAVIGLGTGTMASYARPGQHLTFYDIDPVVRRLSFDEGDPFFTFVEDARQRGAHLELVMGDARLTMERKKLADSEKYGVIVVDAFSSDAIPIHLITREALDVYLDKLAENGLLCFHISNRYLDLRPVLLNLARERDLAAVFQSDNREENYPGKSSSTWVILARKSAYLDGLRELNEYEDLRKDTLRELLPLILWPDNGSGLTAQSYLLYGLLSEEVFKRPSKWEELEPDETWPDLQKVGVWTDDYSNLLSVFSW
jgi:spermidine synthase